MSEPMDYAWGMLKQESSLSMVMGNQQGQGGLGTQLMLPIGRSGGTKGMSVRDQLRHIVGPKDMKLRDRWAHMRGRDTNVHPLVHDKKGQPVTDKLRDWGKQRYTEGFEGVKEQGVKPPSRWRMAAGLGARAANIGLKTLAATEAMEDAQMSGNIGQTIGAGYYGAMAGGIPQLERWADPTRRYGEHMRQVGQQKRAQAEADRAAEKKDQNAQESDLPMPPPPEGATAPGAATSGGAAAPPEQVPPPGQVPPGQTQLTQFGGSAQTELQGTGVSPHVVPSPPPSGYAGWPPQSHLTEGQITGQ